MYSPIPVTRVYSTVYYFALGECLQQHGDHLILVDDVFHEKTTTGDILELAESDAFPTKLLDD